MAQELTLSVAHVILLTVASRVDLEVIIHCLSHETNATENF